MESVGSSLGKSKEATGKEEMNEGLRSDYFGYSVDCAVCGLTKQPIGRSVPVCFVMCDWQCEGYDKDPLPSNLWPSESEEDFGYKVSR
jgi:hypothetical protein